MRQDLAIFTGRGLVEWRQERLMACMLVKALVPTLLLSTTSAFASPAAASRVEVVPSGETFTCTPNAVWDCDGPIWCMEGPRVRLSGIAARELDGSSPGHPCPVKSAQETRDALVRLVGKPTGVGRHGHMEVENPAMSCISDGSAGGSRTAAWCTSPIGGDINCAMVSGGWAARSDRYWRGHECV